MNFAGVWKTILTQKGFVPLPSNEDKYILVPRVTRFLTNILHHIHGQNGQMKQMKLSKAGLSETAFQQKASYKIRLL